MTMNTTSGHLPVEALTEIGFLKQGPTHEIVQELAFVLSYGLSD